MTKNQNRVPVECHRLAAGLGGPAAKLRIYIANRPPIEPYASLAELHPLQQGELDALVQQCSNHWRKLFNVLAKLQFALASRQSGWLHASHSDWRSVRDCELLQRPNQLQLLFTPPEIPGTPLQLVCGKTYAASLGIPLNWLDAHFAKSQAGNLWVSPYPDYRQLTNARIEQLADYLVGI